ncbi:MAG: restriction endonuclease [Deinococcota bacterium]|nr:restriction endonuclease [Deinococcota bacterium]
MSANDRNLPKYHELLNPTLEALHRLGGSASIDELVEAIAKGTGLPPEVIELPHGDGRQTVLEYRLGWARTYLKKFGLLTNSERGIWALTSEGLKTTSVDTSAVRNSVRKQARLKRKSRNSGEELQGGAEAMSEANGISEDSEAWRNKLRQLLLDISPDAFERLCQRLLRESGFIQVEVTGRAGDGGIDGHGVVKIAGLLSFPVIFQSKRYRGSVGAGEVRNFRGAMVGRADKGLFITTGNFTVSASTEATRDGAPPIDLVDGDQLIDMLKELKLGISTRLVEVVEVDSEWFEEI